MALQTNITSLTPSTTSISTNNKDKNAYGYTLIVKIPVPFISLNVDVLEDFVMPALTAVGIPKAYLWLMTNAKDIFQTVVDAATLLIKQIPEIAVTILVQVGDVTVLSIELIAERVPFVIDVPTFALDLPNMAVGLDFPVPIPAVPPVVMRVPIPVPVVRFPDELVTVTGGQVIAGVGVEPVPVPIENPVRLPII